MTVKEYCSNLDEALGAVADVCSVGMTGERGCKSCPLFKYDGKPCPYLQLMDVKRVLTYAAEHNIMSITWDSLTESTEVAVFIRRAVVLGYSVVTLRSCNSEYIKERNLIEIPVIEQDSKGVSNA